MRGAVLRIDRNRLVEQRECRAVGARVAALLEQVPAAQVGVVGGDVRRATHLEPACRSPSGSSPDRFATCADSAAITAPAISLCTAKTSAMDRSKLCDHRLNPVRPSISSAATRTVSPERRTLPSSRYATPSSFEMLLASAVRSANLFDETCAATCSRLLRASSARTSAASPSEKYFWLGSPLRLVKGRTATLLADAPPPPIKPLRQAA